MISLVQNVQVLSQKDIKVNFGLEIGKPGIDMPRSMAATMFMKSTNTHMMFVDDDLAFPPDLIAKLIECDLDIVAVPYRRKQPDSIYVMRMFGEMEQKTDNPALIQVHDIGTGLMLIKREVFEALGDKVEWVNEYGHSGQVGMFFRHQVVDLLPDEGNGKCYMSEDLYFCRLARESGFKIWAYVDAPTAHFGNIGFGGNYADVLEEMLPGEKFRSPK